jgi:ABC-type multidrug transport system ATPase subunit
VLTLTDVTKSFGDRRVLDGVSLEVASGESVALLGANGSGKTTTLRCLVGLSRPDQGSIAICGIDVVRDGVRARSHLSYLPQKSVFPGTLTVRESLAVIARLRPTDRDAVDRELDACGLVHLADRTVAHLSGGERQRLAMGIAFLPTVELYLFDEASANLDPAGRRILVRRARLLNRDGRTVLFTTHVPADVRDLATRAIVLRDGRIHSDNVGVFELRRYERLLEQEIWGDDHDDPTRDGGAVDRIDVDGRLRGTGAVA